MTEIDPARNKYIMLMALRIAATLMIVAGIVLAFGDRRWFEPETQKIVGYLLMAIGFFDLLIIIPMAIRRWKSPQR
jgi:hypothetical protein